MKKPTYHCYGSPREYIRMLKYLNKPFTKQTTTSTRIIITENEKRVYCGESTFLSKREMILQRQLVKNINNNTEGENIIKNPKNKVKYFRFDDSVRRMSEYLGEIVSIKNVLEMDIVKAYYQVAHNLGYIDEDFYKKTLKLPKYIRLRLLGSIATRKIIEDFEGDQLISVKTKTNEKMRNIWFNICLKLDEIIIECEDAIRDYFLFYWVDGIYFKKDEKINDDFLQPSVQIIKHIFESHNLEYTSKNIDELIIINKNNNISLQLYINNKLKSQFCVPKQKVRQVYIEDEHGFKEKILEQFV